MNLHVFNACLLVAWLLVLVGGVMLNPGAGLVAAGLLLLVLVLICVRLAGGVYAPPQRATQQAEGG